MHNETKQQRGENQHKKDMFQFTCNGAQLSLVSFSQLIWVETQGHQEYNVLLLLSIQKEPPSPDSK